jgi:PiT family inorganic phosphate transporter
MMLKNDGGYRGCSIQNKGLIQDFYIPFWVIWRRTAIGLGRCRGWRIVKTMGRNHRTSAGGWLAPKAAAGCLLVWQQRIGEHDAYDYSAIIGVGSTRRLSAVRWGVTRSIVWAWLMTIPAAATIAAIVYELLA